MNASQHPINRDDVIAELDAQIRHATRALKWPAEKRPTQPDGLDQLSGGCQEGRSGRHDHRNAGQGIG